MKATKKFYRYETIQYIGGPKIYLQEFAGVKETPCGWWIRLVGVGGHTFGVGVGGHTFGWDKDDIKKWVSKTAKKRYAYPTKDEAMFNFRMRKLRHISILKSRLVIAEWELNLIEEKRE
jgi:hypothetical protein